jgi:FKBP-type peptidyl-prolyl cis-trans isomerase FkpA
LLLTASATVAKRIDTTGVFYIVIAPGEGNDLYTNSTSVTVDYTGSILTSGQEFAKAIIFILRLRWAK